MTHKSTLIQLKSNEDILMDIDDIIVPAFEGESIMVSSIWYKIVEVTLYTRQLSSGGVAISESLWVEQEIKEE